MTTPHAGVPTAQDMSMEELANPSSLGVASSTASTISLPQRVYDLAAREGLAIDDDGTVSMPSDSFAHPRQWRVRRKVYDTAVICLLEFLTTVISNSGSSVSEDAATQLDIRQLAALACLTTTYLLGQAIGCIVFPPICEVFNSRLIYTSSAGVYAAMCLSIGLVPTVPSVVIGRLVQGLISGMPTIVAIGSIENIWDASARVWALYLWSAAGILGLAIGPVYAVYVREAKDLGWHWVFKAGACAMAGATLLAFGMKESRPSIVLRKKARKLEVAAERKGLRVTADAMLPTWSGFRHDGVLMPVKLFFTERIVLCVSIMGATVVSILYLLAESLPVVYTDSFGMTPQHSSLVFLVIGAGVVCSIPTRCYDMRLAGQRTRSRQIVQPEDKLLGFLTAAPLLALSVWWFAATIPPFVKHISPFASMAPLLFIGFAQVEFDYVLSGYLTDTYQSRAASANASMGFLRAIVSGLYPLFGRTFFEKLGANVASCILASIATLYAVLAILGWKYGKDIRQKSRFAQHIQAS